MSETMTNNEDIIKSYRAAGVALGLSVFKAESLFTLVSLDSDEPAGVTFFPEFYAVGTDPTLTASEQWHRLVARFRVQLGAAIAGVLCQRMVLERQHADSALRSQLLDAAIADGRDQCRLDADEGERLFAKAFDNFTRVFSDATVAGAMQTVAERLQRERTLSRDDVLELLHRLNIIS